MTMAIETGEYSVQYEEATQTVACRGSFRLGGVDEYAPIVAILNSAAAAQPEQITLDLTKLEFLNSAGINVLSKFVISVRQKAHSGLLVRGSKTIPWQGKSLPNLQRLMPALKLELE